MSKRRVKKGRSDKSSFKPVEVEVLPKEEDEYDAPSISVIEPEEALNTDAVEDLDPEPALALEDDIVIDDAEIIREDLKSDSLTRYDPLRAYLSEITQYPKLTKEEELELALRYKDQGDVKAAYQLTVSNLWLVVSIARRYQRAARSLLDLIQEGNIGLMDAVKNFDPYRDVRFPSYASWWIKAYIIRYVIANWRLVKIGTTQAQRKLFFNLEKEREKLEQQGFIPTAKLLAANLNVKESEVIEMQQRLGGRDLSVDAPMGGEDDHSNLHAILPSGELTAEEAISMHQIKERLSRAMADFADTLNERDRVIFERRLLAEEKVTLNDIATEFSLSKERVRQLESRIKDRLKVFMKENLGESFLHSDMGLDSHE